MVKGSASPGPRGGWLRLPLCRCLPSPARTRAESPDWISRAEKRVRVSILSLLLAYFKAWPPFKPMWFWV